MAARCSGRICRFTGARAELGEVCIGCLVKACRSKGLGKHMPRCVQRCRTPRTATATYAPFGGAASNLHFMHMRYEARGMPSAVQLSVVPAHADARDQVPST